MNQDIDRLIRSFREAVVPLCTALGDFTQEENAKQLARDFVSRFLSNVASLANLVQTRDSLNATLLQRYNHELLTDFYYLFSPDGEEDKIQRFFSFITRTRTENAREWSTFQRRDKLPFIPPWIISPETNPALYKALSNLAHPNIISIRLNRRGERYTISVIEDSIVFTILQISNCFMHHTFLELVDDRSLDKNTFTEEMRDIGREAGRLLVDLVEQ